MTLSTAIIACGGEGKRMGERYSHIQKCLLPKNSPIIEFVVKSLVQSGIKKIFFLIGHKGYQIIRHFRNANHFGTKVLYVYAGTKGTAPALKYLEGILDEPFIYCHGDICYKSTLIKSLIKYHYDMESLSTVVLSSENNAPTHAHAVIDSRSKVIEFQIPYLNSKMSGLCCMGIALLHPSFLHFFQKVSEHSMVEEGLSYALSEQYHSHAYIYEESWFHLQTPKDLENLDDDSLNQFFTK